MPAPYDGIHGNIVTNPAMTISSSVVGNPTIVNVVGTLPADFATGVLVDIQGHTVNTKANGIWPATVTGAAQFSIPVNTTGGTNGGGTGTAQPLNMTGSYTIPSDGDFDNNASISPSLSDLGDRSQFLASVAGSHKFVKVPSVNISTNPYNTPWMQLVGPVTGLNPMTGMNGGLSSYTIPGIVGGDIVEVTLETSVDLIAAGAGNFQTRFGLALGFYPYGASAPLVTVFPVKSFSGPGSNTPNFTPLSLRTWTFAPSSLSDGSVGYQLYVAFFCDTFGATETVSFMGDMLLVPKVWRPTTIPQ
jgi:hypothetical protein